MYSSTRFAGDSWLRHPQPPHSTGSLLTSWVSAKLQQVQSCCPENKTRGQRTATALLDRRLVVPLNVSITSKRAAIREWSKPLLKNA